MTMAEHAICSHLLLHILITDAAMPKKVNYKVQSCLCMACSNHWLNMQNEAAEATRNSDNWQYENTISIFPDNLANVFASKYASVYIATIKRILSIIVYN